jgi:hypothetical protein
MDLMKLQNLLNECIMIEQGNYLGGNFSVDLAEAQAELDQAKQLLIPRVVKSLPQDNYCQVCKLPTDGEKCYSKRCPV